MDITKVRSEFPILHRKTYLNSCSLGALSHRATAHLESFQERWRELGASAWYGPWWDPIDCVERVMGLPLLAREEKEAILGENAVRLLGI